MDFEVTTQTRSGTGIFKTQLIIGTAEFMDDWAMPEKMYVKGHTDPETANGGPNRKDYTLYVGEKTPHAMQLFQPLIENKRRVVLFDEAHVLKNNTILEVGGMEVAVRIDGSFPEKYCVGYYVGENGEANKNLNDKIAPRSVGGMYNALLRFLRGDFVKSADKLTPNARANSGVGAGYVVDNTRGIQRVAYFTATPVGQRPRQLANLLWSGYYLANTHSRDAFAAAKVEAFHTKVDNQSRAVIGDTPIKDVTKKRIDNFAFLNDEVRALLFATKCTVCMDLISTEDMPTQDFGLAVLGLGMQGIGLENLNSPYQVQLEAPGIELQMQLGTKSVVDRHLAMPPNEAISELMPKAHYCISHQAKGWILDFAKLFKLLKTYDEENKVGTRNWDDAEGQQKAKQMLTAFIQAQGFHADQVIGYTVRWDPSPGEEPMVYKVDYDDAEMQEFATKTASQRLEERIEKLRLILDFALEAYEVNRLKTEAAEAEQENRAG
jgi:hypothetical protein